MTRAHETGPVGRAGGGARGEPVTIGRASGTLPPGPRAPALWRGDEVLVDR